MFFTPRFHNKRIIDRNTDYFLDAFLFQFICLVDISWEVSLQQGMECIKQDTHNKSVTPKSIRSNKLHLQQMRKLNVEWKGRGVKIHVHKHPAWHKRFPHTKWQMCVPLAEVSVINTIWLRSNSTKQLTDFYTANSAYYVLSHYYGALIYRAAYATLHQWQLTSFLKMTAFWDVVSLKYNDVSEVCTASINSTSGMLVYFNKTTRCCIPKGYHLHTHHYENLKPKNNVWLLICFVSDDIYPVLW
jgi:hypothetical protein